MLSILSARPEGMIPTKFNLSAGSLLPCFVEELGQIADSLHLEKQDACRLESGYICRNKSVMNVIDEPLFRCDPQKIFPRMFVDSRFSSSGFFETIFMMQAAKNRLGNDILIFWDSMSWSFRIYCNANGIGNPRPKARMRSALIVVRRPLSAE
jgi:hypothetical protein